MIDSKFSLEEFKKVDVDNDLSSELHMQLQEEIAKQLHQVVNNAFVEISNQLNKLGHNLTEVQTEFGPKNSTFAYEFNDSSNELNPRICLDTQVCVLSGYYSES